METEAARIRRGVKIGPMTAMLGMEYGCKGMVARVMGMDTPARAASEDHDRPRFMVAVRSLAAKLTKPFSMKSMVLLIGLVMSWSFALEEEFEEKDPDDRLTLPLIEHSRQFNVMDRSLKEKPPASSP